MVEELKDGNVDIGHEHRDVTGGWLRPAVFGAMDGLLSNSSLIAGIAGGVAATGATDANKTLVLAGIAGLVGGAISMGAGEYVSVATQSEAALAEIESERRELELNPEGELHELAALWESRGLEPALALQVATQLSSDPEKALEVHVREELGISPDALPNPWVAAISSFVFFSVGALVPLLPYLFGALSVVPAMSATAISLFLAGVVASKVTSRSWWYNGSRQLVVGAFAGLVTYLLGHLVGHSL